MDGYGCMRVGGIQRQSEDFINIFILRCHEWIAFGRWRARRGTSQHFAGRMADGKWGGTALDIEIDSMPSGGYTRRHEHSPNATDLIGRLSF